jgi:hypothetical protein
LHSSQSDLSRRWTHSHEEDTADQMVFRPEDFPLPPSRGRHGFELRTDGTAAFFGPGSADAPRQQEGHWDLEDSGRLVVQVPDAVNTYQIVSASPEKLVVKK